MNHTNHVLNENASPGQLKRSLVHRNVKIYLYSDILNIFLKVHFNIILPLT